MRMKISRVVEIYNAMTALDGRQKIVTTNNQQQVVTEPYAFDGETQLLLAINKNRLRPHFDLAVELERKVLSEAQAKVQELNSDGLDQKEIERRTQKVNSGLATELQEMRNVEIDVKFKKINISKLKLDENRIPSSEIERIFPMLKYEEPLGEEE